MSTFVFQPESESFINNPYPDYRYLQDHEPIHWSPRLKGWVLTRYEQVRQVAMDQHMSSDRLRPFFESMPTAESARIGDIIRYLSLWMVFTDAPDHIRLRRLTTKVFHAKQMQAMQPEIEGIIAHLLKGLEGREEFDMVKDFAGPLPALVIMRMLGVDFEHLNLVKKLSDEMALFIGSSRATPEKYAIAQNATQQMAQFFRELIADRRKQARADLISELVAVREESGQGSEKIGNDKLSDDELIATCILLLFAGHETTTNHIANGVYSLLKHPAQMRALAQDPSMAEIAVEELLRYDGPSGAQVRIVKNTYHLKTELGEVALEPGQRIFLMLNAANRDPRTYAQADELILNRKGPPHLTFGVGRHVCLGFPLARLEGKLAFQALLKRYPKMRLKEVSPPWNNSLVFRGLQRLPVEVG